jgi:hypothetical protein
LGYSLANFDAIIQLCANIDRVAGLVAAWYYDTTVGASYKSWY